MDSTIPEPPTGPLDARAELARLYDLVCDQGDALARLTRENAALREGVRRALGAAQVPAPPAPGRGHLWAVPPLPA